jgi:predicted RNA-binding protein YlxR (DUF448 family)
MFAVADRDLDNGPRLPKSATERTCALTRATKPVDALIRFVLSPAGEPVPDVKRRLPGRGLWLTASRHAVDEAARRNVFAKGFKKPIKPPPELGAITDRLLLASALDALAIAAKAGQVVAGFTQVEMVLRAGAAAGLIHAADGGEDGIRKLDGLVRSQGAEFQIVRVFSSDELDLALGRSNVIHAALLAGAASKTFLSRCHILVRYRMPDGPAAGDLPSNQIDL